MSSYVRINKTCEYCGSTFVAKTFTTRYCSKQCNSRHYKDQQRSTKERLNITQQQSAHNPDSILTNVRQEYFEVSEACSVLHISRRTLYRLFELRKLKKKKIMSRTVVLKEDIKIFFAHQ